MRCSDFISRAEPRIAIEREREKKKQGSIRMNEDAVKTVKTVKPVKTVQKKEVTPNGE